MLDGGSIMQPAAPTPAAKNYAPTEPLQKLGKQDKPYENSHLNEIVREMHNDIANRYIEARREIVRMAELNANVRSGKMMIKRDPIAGNLALLRPLPGKSRTDWHVYPLAQVNSSQLTSIWTLSRPRIVPRHFGNNNKAQIQHVLIEKVIEHYDAALFDEKFHQEQSLSMMDYGTSAIRVFYDDKLNAMKRLQPIVENVDKTVYEGFGFCRECMHDATPDAFAPKGGVGMGQCPECGSYNLSDMTPSQVVSVPQITGAQELSQGDVGAELLPIGALNWDQRKFIQDSSYSDYISEVPLRLVRSILGLEIHEDNPDDDDGLRAINAMGTRGGSLAGDGRENLSGNNSWASGVAVMHEEHFMPEWYAGRRLPEDEMTACGEVIPKDTPLEQIFPDGMSVAHFNDGQVLAWVGNEKRKIFSGVYHIQSHSGIGKGTTDSIEITEQLNIAHSAGLNMLKRIGAGGGYAYDREVMTRTEAKRLIKPGEMVGLKMRGTDKSIHDLIMQFEHKADLRESVTAVAQLTNLLNISFQTTEFTAGVANDKIDIDTLGGQQMLQSQNQQRSAATLRMKGWMFAQVFQGGVLPCFREHIQIPKFFGTNDRFALTKGRSIAGSDMPEEVKCDFVPDSEIPTNTLTKRQAAKEMLESSQYFGEGGFMALAQFSPRMAAWWAGQFPGVEIPLFDQTEILMVCQDRIDRIAEMSAEIMQRSQISGFFPPPEEAAAEIVAMLRIPMSEENPVVKAEVLKEYLDDDEVKEWPPIQIAATEALIQQLYVNDRDNRFRVPALDQEGQIKLAMQASQAQMAMQAPMMQQQAEMEGQANEQAMLAEGAGRLADEVQATLDFSREEEAKDADFERQERAGQIEQKNKLEQIKLQNAGRKQISNGRPKSAKS